MASSAMAQIPTVSEEPEPELEAGPSLSCCASQTHRLPILLPAQLFTVTALTRDAVVYIVWRLNGSPFGKTAYTGLHLGEDVWLGLRSLFVDCVYQAGRDHIRKAQKNACCRRSGFSALCSAQQWRPSLPRRRPIAAPRLSDCSCGLNHGREAVASMSTAWSSAARCRYQNVDQPLGISSALAGKAAVDGGRGSLLPSGFDRFALGSLEPH
eukprot:86653-Amphidinium_carterae.2